jgi:acyl-CoA thioesterase-1
MRSVSLRAAALLGIGWLIVGCQQRESNVASAADSTSAPAAAPAGSTRPTVLFLGTSLTAGLGLSPEEAYPALVQAKVDSAGLPFRVINAGVSGETSAGALRRVDWLLKQPFDVLVLETGANDMLRGFDVDTTRANIQALVDKVRADRPNARIVLTGMLAMPNLGRSYGARFQQMYPDLAKKNHLAFIPFLLQDVAGVQGLNQADGMHPTAAGDRIVAGTVWKVLEPVLREEAKAAGPGR